MDADTNFFKVFGIPLCWQIDLKVLKEKHRSLQKDFHPDLFVNSSEVEKQRSVEKASVINEGFRVLCSPLSRAQHLLELHGCNACLLYTSPSPRDGQISRMPSSA